MIKDINYFLVTVVSTSLLVYVIFLIFGNVSTTAVCVSNAPDPLTVANNFMVFITIFIAITTILLTIFGFSFTKWYSREKNKIIKENIEEVIDSIVKDSDLKKYLISSIVNSPLMQKDMNTFLNTYTSSQKEDLYRIFEMYKNQLEEIIKEQLKSLNTIEKEQQDVIKINDIISEVYSNKSENEKSNYLGKAVSKASEIISKAKKERRK
ncbi:hypothetical protein N5U26_06550 [Aliarcobacter cryaerophilus]|uniref:hypothetical protein n=1 Tax=Aliarcobacter cryaerophilus TaxID=28198 RepID=UPI0021B5AF15|nr:hypothetical protein [Aliarcobacter cryaerophilus]MCT7510003.1 hypothetical protein [Aliarcobacter cryaerophilus]